MSVRRFLVPALVATLFTLAPGLAGAQTTGEGYPWDDGGEEALRGQPGLRVIVPERYRFLNLDAAGLQQRLAGAPMEFTRPLAESSVVLTLPLPDGTWSRFRVEESPIMEPELARQYPNIKTYRGQGIDDPTASTRFGWTSAGFHAIVLRAGGSFYIDPYRRGDTQHYVSFWKRDYKHAAPFVCTFEGKTVPEALLDTPASLAPSGDRLRTYRLALAANVEYSAFQSAPNAPNKPAVNNNGIIPTMNRVDLIYEREVAVRMVLIANNDSLIFLAEPDGYDNTANMINVNQGILDGIVGNAAYDIGHVFSTGGGGIAGLGVVCDNGDKAAGVTGNSSPRGDGFDVDYVAHEMGHQFGGNHTFNSNTSNCGGGNRNGSTAFEVGSGSTIMAYAGICGADDLQPHSDDDFQNISYVELTTYTQTGGGNACAVNTATGNHAPVVNAGPNFNIPARTPFTLTGSATDSDGDALTYIWDEMDLGPANNGRTDNGSSPIFRSFNDVATPSRTFPKLSDILNNVTTYGELMPTTTRALKFRLMARDNKAGGGGVDWAATQLNVTGTAGPFQVTAPNTNVTWLIGQPATVTWDVAGTTAAPISTAQVNILFSSDGGQTFPITLAAATPNDGLQSITVPNNATSTARVKVEAVGNVFFDISNVNFNVQPVPAQSAAPVALAVDAAGNGVLQPGEAVVMAPSWQNTGTGSLASAGGTLSNFTGPGAPATYTVIDLNAAYGTIAPGATASCTATGNCYGLLVQSGARPVQHWDATVNEAFAPSGNAKTWTVHVGDSFTDMPGSSPYFKFVETLLHKSVTGGCGGTNYCGGTATPREQMSVFVLVSKEGSAYNPPACTTPMFSDVPASSPFCKWIEELARRGVISGCGSGIFCPGSAVTREQMSIFVLKTLDPALNPPACVAGSERFADVPASSPFCKWIEELARRGVVTGCDAVNYCPAGGVTREQMAVFLTATFGLKIYTP